MKCKNGFSCSVIYMSMMNSSAPPVSKFAVIGIAAITIIGGGFWYYRSDKIEALYIDAAADCAAGLGDARLRSVDSLYGEGARPDKLDFDLSICQLQSANDRLIQAVDDLN